MRNRRGGYRHFHSRHKSIRPLRPRTHGNVFLRFFFYLLFSRESRTTSSLLETIQKRRKTFPCVRGLSRAMYLRRKETLAWNAESCWLSFQFSFNGGPDKLHTKTNPLFPCLLLDFQMSEFSCADSNE